MNISELSTAMDTLRSGQSGLFGPSLSSVAYIDEPEFTIRTTLLGNIATVSPSPDMMLPAPFEAITGSGGVLDNPSAAKALADAEALERYCSTSFDVDDMIVATATELGPLAEAMLESLPRHSWDEVEHSPHLRSPGPDDVLRWVWSQSLVSGERIPVPAVCVYLMLAPLVPVEGFWPQISTGCAVHSTQADAALNGLLEVVERDSISTWWLAKRSLPTLVIDTPDDELARHLARFAERNTTLQIRVDQSVPGVVTLIGVERTGGRTGLDSVVGASTSTDPDRALTKLLRELVSCRQALASRQSDPEQLPDDFDLFGDVHHGALYVGRLPHETAFGFMYESTEEVALSTLRASGASSPDDRLRAAVKGVQSCGSDVVAVDIATDEARRLGMSALRMIAPGMQPMSFVHRGRFLGTQRLRDVLASEGKTIDQINPLPMPMA